MSLVKFGDSMSNGSRDIRAAHFVMDDDERTIADAGRDMKQKCHSAFCLRRTLPIGGARQNAAPLNLTIVADIKSNSVRHYW